ncbi:HAD family hydrolase [Nocardia sp. NPDC005366]|uniref:HAD family hydrolase n=1 Tax=Nocardia sp. NPDC005366 TaxID=3156878 RepID=UPI00339E9E03
MEATVNATSGEVWAFDVDGCLIDLLGGASLRPHARELLTALNERGVRCVLWSGGGARWAQGKATQFGLGELLDGYYGKPSRGPDGRWRFDHLPQRHRPAVCVDDSPGEVPLGVRIIGVSPYTAPNDHDQEFVRLCAQIAATSSVY